MMFAGSEVIYVGFFLDEESTEKLLAIPGRRLSRRINNPHITTAFKPKTFNAALLGKPLSFDALRYANDGDNEGMLVGNFAGDLDVVEEVSRVSVPHITISVSEGGKPVNTAYLPFTNSLTDYVHLTARFGAFCADGKLRFKQEEISSCD